MFEFIENQVTEVGPGVWLRTAVDNIAWADLGNHGVIIDALEDPSQADVVKGLLKETSGQDLRNVVSTHWDLDHIACNPQWKREGATIIAHESCARSAGAWEGRPDVSFGNDAVFEDVAVLRGPGERRIEMTYVGGTHTQWDTVLYFPHAKVLHIADLFGWGLIPCRPTAEKIGLLRRILAWLDGYEADAVICGHGPALTLEHLRRFNKYLDELIHAVTPLAQQGLSVEEIEKKVPPPGDMEDWWRFVAWKHSKNVAMLVEDWVPKHRI